MDAVIVDTRGGADTAFVINNVIKRLRPQDQVVWYAGQATDTQAVLRLLSDMRKVTVRYVDDSKGFSIAMYNTLMTTPAFYESLREEILIFQPDCCFEAISLHRMDEFRKYDYIGAPWPKGMFPEWHWTGQVGNGGFSFRRRSAMLRALQTIPYRGETNEDVYFAWTCREIIRIAPYDVGCRFASELRVDYPGACGFHKNWQAPGYHDVHTAFHTSKELLGLQGAKIAKPS